MTARSGPRPSVRAALLLLAAVLGPLLAGPAVAAGVRGPGQAEEEPAPEPPTLELVERPPWVAAEDAVELALRLGGDLTDASVRLRIHEPVDDLDELERSAAEDVGVVVFAPPAVPVADLAPGPDGTTLLGVRAVIAESFERIHRSNLIGMGVIPLQFPEGESAASLKLDGTEVFDIAGIEELNNGKTPKTVKVTAKKEDGSTVEFDGVVRIDTPGEADYYRNGGILQFVLRNMLKS